LGQIHTLVALLVYVEYLAHQLVSTFAWQCKVAGIDLLSVLGWQTYKANVSLLSFMIGNCHLSREAETSKKLSGGDRLRL